jgi:hypothetical protein
MGGSLWELSKLMIFIKNLIRNRSFGEWCFFFKFSMISSDGFWRSWGFNLSIEEGNPLKIKRVGK